jgi:hypothetical protein
MRSTTSAISAADAALKREDYMLTDDDRMRQRFREIIRDAIDKQGQRFKAELEAGVDAERAEWIRTFLAFHKMNRARIGREEEERSRPRYMN